MLAQAGATVCHNPRSNLRLKNGIAPVSAMLAAGVNVSLGTDSTAINDDDDMLQEMRLASKLHRQPGIGAPEVGTHQALKIATANAAKPTFFHDRIGALEPGKKADIILLDLTQVEEPYLDLDTHIVDALVYRGKARQVDTVIINGEVVLRGGQFTKVNKADVVKELRDRFSAPIDSQTLNARQMVQRLIPFVAKFYEGWQPTGNQPFYEYNSSS